MSIQRAGNESELIRPADVCARLDVQPYILKFWESEFPLLGRRVGAKRLYDEAAFEMVREIRRLVLDERRSLAEARTVLDARFGGEAPPPASAEATMPAASGTAEGAGAEALAEKLRQARERVGLLEREVEAAQDLLRRVQALQGRVAELEDALARADADRRGALAAQAAELNADLAKSREAVRGREDELRRAREETTEIRRHLEEEKQVRLKAATQAARVPDLADQLARLERELAAERQRHGETSALLEGLRARQAEWGQRDLEWRTGVSNTISAALREVREIAFHAEGLEKALEPIESRPRRVPPPAPVAPVPEPPADIEDLAAEALQESLAGAEKPDDEPAAPAEPSGPAAGNGSGNGYGGPAAG
ncbi:MAG: MerR family transcriptional regulator [Acidobacteria bacterium]|nr:MerR family transcriptional regulator [Acidobacteriota bacterium]